MPLRFDDARGNTSWRGTSHHKLAGETAMRFVGVDGEGVGRDEDHRYVLFGVGEDQIEGASLDWETCFPFLYERLEPGVAFVGFFLLYDFTQIFKTLPEERAWRLWTAEGRASRRHRSPHRMPHPVEYGGWQFDLLGTKRLRIRPKTCVCREASCQCRGKKPWLYLCDVGGFFQTSLLSAIDPAKWNQPVVSEAEYLAIKRGKERRKEALLDDEMRYYNRLENVVLSRVMGEIDSGLLQISIHLPPQKWFGPGQIAQAWLKGKAPEREIVKENVPEEFMEAARKAYYGGWFETFVHGVVPGVVYEYDINSAYPDVISGLPCLLHGEYRKGVGKYERSNGDALVLVHAEVAGDTTQNAMVGAMLHRDKNGRILRPVRTSGWYWLDELEAAVSSGCVHTYRVDEWQEYVPCDCPPPMQEMRGLYQKRLEVGKDTPLGISAKLGYNSGYGKFAQSVGEPVFGNAVYASLITSGCRRKILQAISTHPMGARAVVMVATDAVFFLEPHPGLVLSDKLGEWGLKERRELTVFKPGVYWDQQARDSVQRGDEIVRFKARGINAKEFAKHLEEIDDMFRGWNGKPPSVRGKDGVDLWPSIEYETAFSMTTCLQAIRQGEWSRAGKVVEGKTLRQSSNPRDKRESVWWDRGRGVYRSRPHMVGNADGSLESFEYKKRFGMDDPWSDENRESFGVTPDGYAGSEYRETIMEMMDWEEGIDYNADFNW